ncbi:MAG: protein kinase [Myxococcales bacterium]|nr:protein kinase [Myxococcales bacterium]
MTPHPADLPRGRVLGGKYQLEEPIGRGGFGAVYRAIQAPVGREVAVKVTWHAVDDPRLRARFLREARVLARITDPAVITLHDFGEEPDGLLYMVQALVVGRSLADVLDGGRRLDPARALAITIGVLRALEAAHALGVVHRDIKPDNIMLTADRDGREAVRVLDFGIAKLLEDDDGYQTTRGQTVGTPPYMAPEQTRAKGIGPATDLYAAGVLLYRMLTGRLPYLADSHFETMMLHRKAPLPPMDGLPPPIAAALTTALQKKPEDRHPDAAAMRRALEAIEPGGAITPRHLAAEDAAAPTVRAPSPVELDASRLTPAAERPATVKARPAAMEGADTADTATDPVRRDARRATALLLLAAVVAAALGAWLL